MAKTSFFQKRLNYIYEKFHNDTSLMLIVTGSLGWILSSCAQIGAIFINSKINTEKKTFLLPQEIMDGLINVACFAGFTFMTKMYIEKMIKTGKLAPKSVRNFLNKNEALYKNKIGKIDFNLDNVLTEKLVGKELSGTYNSYKNFMSTMGTLGASVLSCNVITPLIRNKTASRVQNTYKDMKQNPTAYPAHSLPPSTGMRI